MSIIKPSTAFKAGADWESAEVRAYMKDQVSTHVDTVQDVRDNDFELTRFLWVREKAATYALNLSSGEEDDGDRVIRDNVGRRYVKIPVAAETVDNSVDRPKLRVNFNKSVMLAPQEYGVVADGGNDTSGMVAWAAACQAEGLQPYLPEGEYTSAAGLDFSAAGGAIRGAGEGKTIVRFTNAGSAGFRCAPSSPSGPFGVFSLDGLTLKAAAVVGGSAIDLVLPDDGVWSNSFRFGARNLEILPESGTGGYFGVGVHTKNVSFSECRKIRYWGSAENPTASNGYFAGIGILLETQKIADDVAYGVALSNHFTGIETNFCETGIAADGFAEGIFVSDSSFAFVRNGVLAVAANNSRQPMFNVHGTHINAVERCITLSGYSQSSVLGCHLGRVHGPGDFVWIGVDLQHSMGSTISNNQILHEMTDADGLAGYGIRLSGDSWYTSIGRNHFAGAITPSGLKPLAAGLVIETGVAVTKFDASNQFAGQFDVPVIDNSGNATNQYYLSVVPGITVKADGAPVGTSPNIRSVDFSDNFDVAAAGSDVAVELADEIAVASRIGVGVAAPLAALHAKVPANADSLFRYDAADGTNLWNGRYDGSNFHTFLNRRMYFNAGASNVGVNFIGGEGVGGSQFRTLTNAADQNAGNAGIRVCDSGEAAATAANPLGKANIAFRPRAWNGTNGTAVGSLGWFGLEQQSATNNDGKFIWRLGSFGASNLMELDASGNLNVSGKLTAKVSDVSGVGLNIPQSLVYPTTPQIGDIFNHTTGGLQSYRAGIWRTVWDGGNLPPASQLEAEAGTGGDGRAWSPQRVRQNVQAYVDPILKEQSANGADMVLAKRATDVSPTGYFVRYRSAADDHNIWSVDTAGNLNTVGLVNGANLIASSATAAMPAGLVSIGNTHTIGTVSVPGAFDGKLIINIGGQNYAIPLIEE